MGVKSFKTLLFIVLMRYTIHMAKKTTKRLGKKASKKVDFEPNKMGLAIASLGAVTIALFAVIAMNA